MTWQTTEGIILQSVPYKESDQILTLFTPDRGILSAYHRGKKKNATILSPLNRVELSFREGRGDMVSSKEIHLLDHFASLRSSYSQLQAACRLLYVIRKTQLPEKEAGTLYALFRYYLERFDQIKKPETAVASFILKVLKHDGFFSGSDHCSSCGSEVRALGIYRGEIFCREHTPEEAIAFEEEEGMTLLVLTHSRSLKEIIPLSLHKDTYQKIEILFSHAVEGP